MVGTMIGEITSALSSAFPRKASRARAAEVMVPVTVARTVTSTATFTLRRVASSHGVLDQYARCQRVESTRGGNSRKTPPLNDMAITTRLGTTR